MKYLILIPLLLLVTGCGVGSEEIIMKLDSNLIITPHEEFHPDKRVINLDVVTEKIYGCMNYSIDYSQSNMANYRSVYFNGIIDPGMCLTALGPAACRLKLHEGSPVNYSYTFKNGNAGVKAIIQITDELIKISPEDSETIKFPVTELRRIPNNYYWGYTGYTIDSSNAAYLNFIDSLKSIGCVFNKLTQGNYGYFSVNEAGNIHMEGMSGYRFTEYTAFNFSGDESQIKSIIEYFKSNRNIYLYFMNTKGSYL